MNLLPIPKKLTYLNNHCQLTIQLPDKILIDSPPVEGINEKVDLQLAEQAFKLLITEQTITISFNDKLGRFYGLNILKQMLQQTKLLPCVQIEDKPDYLNRGIILDISRDKVPKLTTLYCLIDLWSQLRINKLQLYTEHTFAYAKHHQVWKNSSAYTGKDIQAIDRYCRKKGIELVINQATFGHMERWLQHDDYKYLAEQTTGFTDQRGDFRPFSFGVNPIGDMSANFIESLLDELVPNFTSNTININFDETMDLGVDASREACEKLGKGEVYVNYLNKLLSITQTKGLHTQIFSDMLFHYPQILAKLPKELTLLNWGYEANHPFDKEHQQLQETGLPFEVVVSTCCFASITGRWQNTQQQMLSGARSGLTFGAQGYHISEWGDMGHAQQSCMPIPAYIYGAALAWGVEKNKDIDVTHWLALLYCEGDKAVAKIILALQDIYLETEIDCPNCAFFGPLLFDQKSARHINRSTGLSEQGFNKAHNKLVNLLAEIRALNVSYLQTQLIWSAEALLHACLLGTELVKQNTRQAQCLDRDSKAKLHHNISPLINEYKRLWLIDNRDGGLNESVERLYFLQSLYLQ